MSKVSGVAVGAGLASALLFAAFAKGSLAVALLTFTALPVMIAAMGYGHFAGLWGAAIATGTVAIVIGPVLAGFYAASIAFPGWWLAYLALLARPVEDASTPAVNWYPIGRIAAWAALLAACTVILLGARVLYRYFGYQPALQALSVMVAEALSLSAGTGAGELADLSMVVVRVSPAVLAALSLFLLLLNLWLAARVSQVSGRLARPWPDVPQALRLPVWSLATLPFLFAPFAVDSAVSTALATVAAAFAMAFALQGLAAAHALTRGVGSRNLILTALYLVTVVAMPWPLLALTLLGVADALFGLRDRRQKSTASAKPTGEQPWK